MSAMSVQELGDRLGISRRSAYRLIEQRLIATIPVGTGSTPRLRVTEAALAAFLKRREHPAKAA